MDGEEIGVTSVEGVASVTKTVSLELEKSRKLQIEIDDLTWKGDLDEIMEVSYETREQTDPILLESAAANCKSVMQRVEEHWNSRQSS